MEGHEFDSLLGRLRSDAVPPAPGALEQDVWRQIRLSQEGGQSIYDRLAGLLTSGRVALSMLAAVVVMSGVLSAGVARQYQSPGLEVSALDFGSLTHPMGLELTDDH